MAVASTMLTIPVVAPKLKRWSAAKNTEGACRGGQPERSIEPALRAQLTPPKASAAANALAVSTRSITAPAASPVKPLSRRRQSCCQ
jgi:hypothetical protein